MTAAPSKTNNQSEPTNYELVGMIEDLTKAMYTGFEGMNKRFERIEGVLSTLQLGQDNLLVEVQDIKRRVVHLEFQMADVQDLLCSPQHLADIE